MSRFALGTAQLGFDYGVANSKGRISDQEARAIFNYALSVGIHSLDTAVAYGDSEKRLGALGVQDWQVVSKLPPVVIDYKTCVLSSLEQLKIKKLYGLLLHKPEQLLESEGSKRYRDLLQLKEMGLVQKIGISVYGPEELELLCSRFQLDIIQAPLSILDRRLISSGWMDRLWEQNIEIYVRSVFLQGLLLMKSQKRPQYFLKWKSLFEVWDSFLRKVQLSPLQACLRYVLSFKKISKVVIGIDSLEQLKEIWLAHEGERPQVPNELRVDDLKLLNPSKWEIV